MTVPVRIQRSRVKGWRMPTNALYVGRGSRWGNPFIVGNWTVLTGVKAGLKADAEDVVELFAYNLKQALQKDPSLLDPLTGKDLACWCPLDRPCHADTLLTLANGDPK